MKQIHPSGQKNFSAWHLFFALSLTVCGAGLPAHAADLTLKELLEISVQKHPSVLQARSQAQAAGFDLDAAQWGRFPTGSFEVRTKTYLSQNLAKIEQPVWTGGKISSRIGLSESNLRVAEAAIREAQITALTQASTAFYEALRLDQRLVHAALNVQEHERLVAMIERRTLAEVSPPADTTLAKARLQQAVSERIQIKKQRDAALATLAQWTQPLTGGLKAPAGISFIRPASEADMTERALAYSGQRQRLLSQIDSAEAQIESSQAQIYPTLVAGVQHTWAGDVPITVDRNQSYLSLQYQTGAGLSTRSGIQAAVSRKAAAQQELEALQLNLTTQVSAAMAELDALQAQLEPAKELLLGTTEVVESYLRQYQLGRKNWLDVLNAQREKTQALYNQADIQYGYQLAQIRLMILSGDLSAQQLIALHD